MADTTEEVRPASAGGSGTALANVTNKTSSGLDLPSDDLPILVTDSYKFLSSHVHDELLRTTLFAASLEVGWSESSFCKVLSKLWNILKVRTSSDLRRLLGAKDDASNRLKESNKRLFKNATYAVLEKHLTKTATVANLVGKKSSQKKNQLEIELEKTNKHAPLQPDTLGAPPTFTNPRVLQQLHKLHLRPRSQRILAECAGELSLAHSESEKIFEMIASP